MNINFISLFESVDKKTQDFNQFQMNYLFDNYEDIFGGLDGSLQETPEPHLDELQTWGVIPNWVKDEEERIKWAEKIYQEASGLALKFKDTFTKLLHKLANLATSFKPKVLVDVKTYTAFSSKILLRAKAPANKIHDILRAAILLNTKEEVSTVVNMVRKNAVIVEHEYKEPGSDKKYGYYGSHHFKVLIGNRESKDRIICEVQVMTKSLWEYKEEAHKIYAAYRNYKDAEKTAVPTYKADMQRSRTLFKSGNKR